jgi:hypothetical protein
MTDALVDIGLAADGRVVLRLRSPHWSGCHDCNHYHAGGVEAHGATTPAIAVSHKCCNRPRHMWLRAAYPGVHPRTAAAMIGVEAASWAECSSGATPSCGNAAGRGAARGKQQLAEEDGWRRPRRKQIKIRRVDFYPDDWIAGTVNLSHQERSVYISVCAAIWSRGECQWRKNMCARFVGPNFLRVLNRLVAKGKVERVEVDGEPKVNQKTGRKRT